MSKIPVIFYKNFPPLYTKLKIGDNPVFDTKITGSPECFRL